MEMLIPEDKQGADNTEKGEAGEEVEKAKGAKKKLFKNVQAVGGTTKKRLVQNLLSPRKRAHAKNMSKQGEGAKQMEEQGTSNPKPSTFKP